MKKHAGVCTGCSTGCSIWTEENQDTVHRLKPHENPAINQWWMSTRDATAGTTCMPKTAWPSRSAATATNVNIQWPEIVAELQTKLATSRRLAAVFRRT